MKTSEEDDTLNAILVHCGEHALPLPPVEEPALPPLADDSGLPSGYFDLQVKSMFEEYATSNSFKLLMDSTSTAFWLSACFSESIGPHSQIVTSVLAEHGTKGEMPFPAFRSLYINSLSSGNFNEIRRDFSAHAPFVPPAPPPTRVPIDVNMWDECVLYDMDTANEVDGESYGPEKPSYLRVETLSSDSEVPTKIKDGEFMFVDEDSCIGCSNCAFYAPDSFKMLLSTGRARAYSQSRDRAGSISAALASCPVDCIKPVSFKELKLFENARENGDGRSDHKHNGRGPNNGNGTPLYVSGMSSDNNHRSSWYHTLKHRCLMSGSCPSKGCYDCPHYTEKGANPFFKEKNEAMERKRMEELMDTVGAAMRNRADL